MTSAWIGSRSVARTRNGRSDRKATLGTVARLMPVQVLPHRLSGVIRSRAPSTRRAERTLVVPHQPGGPDHERRAYRSGRTTALKQGQAHRGEAPVQALGDLGDPDSAPDRPAHSGPCPVQPRHRQQVARLRPCDPAGPGCRPWHTRLGAPLHRSTQDRPAGAVRTHGADPQRYGRLDRSCGPAPGGFPISVPAVRFSPPVDPTVRADRQGLGEARRATGRGLRDPLAAADQGHAHVPSNDATVIMR